MAFLGTLRSWPEWIRHRYDDASGGFRWSASVVVDDVPRLTRAIGAAALSMLIGVCLGWSGAATATLIGTCAVVYGESAVGVPRWRVVGGYGVLLLVAATLGLGVGALTRGLGYPESSAIFVVTMSLLAGIAAAIVKVVQSRPPGSFLIVLVFELVVVLVQQGVPPARVLVGGALGCGGALVAVVVVDSLLARSRRWPTVPPFGSRDAASETARRGVRRMTMATRMAVRGGSARFLLARRLCIQLGVAALISGGLAAVLGLPRPDWAVMSAAMVLHQGPARGIGTVRGLHRLVGTLLGCVVFVAIGWAQLPLPALLVAAAVFFAFGDLFLSRHYGMAMVFLTPTIFIVGSQGVTGDVVAAAATRIAETTIGVVVAIAVLLSGFPDLRRRVSTPSP